MAVLAEELLYIHRGYQPELKGAVMVNIHGPTMATRSDATNDDVLATDFSPLVAVVTPVYNGGTYLDATMQCVQRQTYKNVVHVVLDNCSTDNTAEIIDRYRGGRIKLLAFRNDRLVSPNENWTRALRAVPAETAYVKVLCADDLMRSDCISLFVEIAESDPEIEVVLCDDIFRDLVHHAHLDPHRTVFNGVEVSRRVLNTSINWLPYHQLFMRFHDGDRASKIFGDIPIFFDAFATVFCALRGKFAYLREPLVYSRWHANSITSSHLHELEPLLASFDTFMTFGRLCWSEEDFQVEYKRARRRLGRRLIRAVAAGNWAEARKFSKNLEGRGVRFTFLDYAGSVVDFIRHTLWKRGWKQRTGAQIDEVMFVAEKLP